MNLIIIIIQLILPSSPTHCLSTPYLPSFQTTTKKAMEVEAAPAVLARVEGKLFVSSVLVVFVTCQLSK